MAFTLKSKAGDEFCGDRFLTKRLDESTLYVIFDAIGHGQHASCIADTLYEFIEQSDAGSLKELILASQITLFQSRGVVICFALFSPHKQQLDYFSVGNIKGFLISAAGVTPLQSVAGIFGAGEIKVKINQVRINEDTKLLMFTDGLKDVNVNVCKRFKLLHARHVVSFLTATWQGEDDICCFCEELNEQ